jgi:integrase
MASIFKRRGRWVLKFRDVTGRWRSPSYPTRRRAEEAAAGVVEQRRQPVIPVVDPDITLGGYAERWLGQIAGSVKPSTVEHYRQRVRIHIGPAFGAMKVCQLHRGAIKALLSEKLAAGLAVDSVRLIHATIRAMLNAAVDDGVILANPAIRLGKVLHLVRSKAARQENIKAFDRDQLARFLAAALRMMPRLYPLFLTMARTGLRIGEALVLQWDDLDLEGREIRVERAVNNSGVISTPKSRHGRTVDMSRTVVDVLRHHRGKLAAGWLQRRPEPAPDGTPLPKGEMPPWVFPSEAWTPMDHANVGKAFKRVPLGSRCTTRLTASATRSRRCSSSRACRSSTSNGCSATRASR